jgi:uncharacterized coiled-coil protein SlyX
MLKLKNLRIDELEIDLGCKCKTIKPADECDDDKIKEHTEILEHLIKHIKTLFDKFDSINEKLNILTSCEK